MSKSIDPYTTTLPSAPIVGLPEKITRSSLLAPEKRSLPLSVTTNLIVLDPAGLLFSNNIYGSSLVGLGTILMFFAMDKNYTFYKYNVFYLFPNFGKNL